MNRELRRKIVGMVIALTIVAICSTPQFKSVVNFPEEVRLQSGSTADLPLNIPFALYVRSDRHGMVRLNGEPLGDQWRVVNSPIRIESESAGRVNLEFRLFGLIPFKSVVVDIIPTIHVVPGGQSIGVVLQADGVIVVGFAAVEGPDGRVYHPARDRGVRVGDVITHVDGRPVRSQRELSAKIQAAGESGRAVTLTLQRGEQTLQRPVQPRRAKDGRYLLGIFVRDSAAGVGTLTFHERTTGKYVAIGHVISDSETNRPIEVRSGQILSAEVSTVHQGKQGSPGEKVGVVTGNAVVLGNIERNTPFGIVGTLKTELVNPYYESIPVALASEVVEGPAEIITVISGRRMEKFRVEILRVRQQRWPDDKGLVVEIVDERLLRATGGIIQGMSGSPIIQKGRLVGAITHVFVNDPTRGYGVYAEWMLRESGILEELQRRYAEKTEETSFSGYGRRKAS